MRTRGEWPRERFASHGVTYDVSSRNKSAIYGEFLPALNGQRVRLLDLPRLTGQLVSLERRTARGGRDSVDYAPGAHDDVANAVCGVLVNLIADRRPALVRKADMLDLFGEALPLPRKLGFVVAVLCTDEKGNGAVVYGGLNAAAEKPAMFIIDFDVGPMQPDIFTRIPVNVAELIVQCRVSNAGGGVVFVPDDMHLHAAAAGLTTAEIPPDILPEARPLSVSAHVAEGNVKLCAPALEKARKLPFAGALDFRAGENAEDPL
jgi:hypothetical protein